MKHIINEYNSESVRFKDSIELELSDAEHAAIRIEIRSDFKGETNPASHKQVTQHITASQALQIIADLSKLLEEDALNKYLASS